VRPEEPPDCRPPRLRNAKKGGRLRALAGVERYNLKSANVAELADALDLGSSG
jgi:hypothetical protein